MRLLCLVNFGVTIPRTILLHCAAKGQHLDSWKSFGLINHNSIMLQELIDLIDTEEYDINNSIITTSEEELVRKTEILLKINKCGFVDETQLWKIICQGVREQPLGLEWNDFFELTRNHVLLWPHVQNRCPLYFNGSKRDATFIVGQLWERHFGLVGRWFPFERFLNQAYQFTEFIGDGYGLLAQGPESLIFAYKEILDEHGYKTSVMSHVPTFWDGEKFIQPGELVAFIMGQSYVVAADVDAYRIKDEAC